MISLPSALQLLVEVQQNPFEHMRIPLTGECYMEMLAFEGLPGGSVDELKLDDFPLNVPAQMSFTLRNMSEKHFRCASPAAVNRQACRAGIYDSLLYLTTDGWHWKSVGSAFAQLHCNHLHICRPEATLCTRRPGLSFLQV